MRGFVSGFFALFFVFTQPVLAENSAGISSAEALSLLHRISTALRQHNYVGTFVYSSGDRIETSRIVHMMDRDGTHEKIEVLDGTPREIIRTNNEIKCYLPERKTVITEKRWLRRSFPSLFSEPVSALNDSYIVRLGGYERVTDYESRMIILEPRDNMRYGHKLWMETNTGLLLKAAVVDKERVMEQFVFTQLKIDGEIDKVLLKTKYADKAVEWQANNLIHSGIDSNDTGWSFKNLPPGFKKISAMKLTLPGKAEPVSHIVLSDGLAAVSVFVETLDKSHPSRAPKSYRGHGAINIFAHPVSGSMVTAVGEAPAAAIRHIGISVVHEQSGSK